MLDRRSGTVKRLSVSVPVSWLAMSASELGAPGATTVIQRNPSGHRQTTVPPPTSSRLADAVLSQQQ